MGRRGPAPKPTRVKILQGNPGHRRLPTDEVQPAVGDKLKCPSWLHKHARAKWRELAPILLRLGLLTEADGESFAIACQTWAEWRLAVERLNADGLTVEVKGKLRQHPFWGVARAAWE